MKLAQIALTAAVAFAVVAPVANAADSAVYASIEPAQAACGADKVVFIDLDRGRYYKLNQGNFAKSSNGVYACESMAHAKYREGHVEATAVANK
jgi:hypothetical protein